MRCACALTPVTTTPTRSALEGCRQQELPSLPSSGAVAWRCGVALCCGAVLCRCVVALCCGPVQPPSSPCAALCVSARDHSWRFDVLRGHAIPHHILPLLTSVFPVNALVFLLTLPSLVCPSPTWSVLHHISFPLVRFFSLLRAAVARHVTVFHGAVTAAHLFRVLRVFFTGVGVAGNGAGTSHYLLPVLLGS